MSKRSHVVSAIERAIDELAKREREIASALAAPTEKTLFEFGRICGQFQENHYSRSVLEHCLNAGDPSERHEES